MSLALAVLPLLAAGSPATATMFGANKFDLMLDYLTPLPPTGSDPDGYRRVRVAMAQKAFADARDAGLSFFRFAATGYGPSEINDNRNELALWQRSPTQFWRRYDQLFDDADAAGMRLVPSFAWHLPQFPALGHESIGTFLRDPNSASRRHLAQFVREFIARYRGRQTILFYEMGNELNLLVDINNRRRQCRVDPCIWDDFTTADMNKFGREIADLIRSLDPSRPISSGYSLPRAAAAHLENRPEFASGGGDWTADTPQEFTRDLVAIHQPFDIISIHQYARDLSRHSGRNGAQRFDPLHEAAMASRVAGKKLFLGEYGDATATPFLAHVLDDIVGDHIDFAAIWIWEFYQQSTFKPAPFSVEPGLSEPVIRLLLKSEERAGKAPASTTVSRPRVVLTWPLPCAQINRPAELYAVASDGVSAVNRVDFFADGNPIASIKTPPYRTQFDPVGIPPHTAMIEARAVAASGATASFRSPIRLHDAHNSCDPAQK